MLAICAYTLLIIILIPVSIVIFIVLINILFFIYVTAASKRLSNIDQIYFKELKKRQKKLDKRK